MTRAIIATEAGDIEVDLFTQGAPLAAANFIKLAKQGFYDDVIFHRVIPNFMIQGGDGQFGKKSSIRPAMARWCHRGNIVTDAASPAATTAPRDWRAARSPARRAPDLRSLRRVRRRAGRQGASGRTPPPG